MVRKLSRLGFQAAFNRFKCAVFCWPQQIFPLLLLLLSACNHREGNDAGRPAVDQARQSRLIGNLEAFDVPLGHPKAYEWLAAHKEQGQTYEKYVQGAPVKPLSPRSRIYLQPLGKFTETENRIILNTSEYLRLFFDLEIIVREAITDKIVPVDARRGYGTAGEQLQTIPILNYLEKTLPGDAAVFMAITNKDLYPSDSYNFVFGQARTRTRVGVSSFVRYYVGGLDSANEQLCLARLIKTSAHEIGHMFTMHHCIHAVCLMNGSNGMEESDSRPNRLCSECLRKLQWNVGFDVVQRAKATSKYFKDHNNEEDYRLTERDLSAMNQNPL